VNEPRQIAIVIYPGYTALDALGPYHVLAQTPGYRTIVVSETGGPVSDGGRLVVNAQASLAEVPAPDVVVVAGGVPAIEMARSGGPIVDWLATVRDTASWLTSVCTGSLLLGAAGILDGIEATSHWFTLEALRSYGAVPVERRVVEVGKVITAAGVSAGIDMALLLETRLASTHVAQMIQLDMEYAPEPLYAAGHPRSAPAAVTSELRAMYEAMTAPIPGGPQHPDGPLTPDLTDS
jgi:transcriptional regulator GlxA family with amidase domain